MIEPVKPKEPSAWALEKARAWLSEFHVGIVPARLAVLLDEIKHSERERIKTALVFELQTTLVGECRKILNIIDDIKRG